MPRHEKEASVGQSTLIAKFDLRVPDPAVTSIVGPGARKTIIDGGRSIEKYPASYRPDDTLIGHLKFALRYEPIQLGVLAATFKVCDKREIEAWIKAEPNGAYARRAWFLYEWLSGKKLNVPDAGVVGYVDALDTKLHFTVSGVVSKRHRVANNIPGVPGFAPTIRRTARLDAFVSEALDAEARKIIAGCDPSTLTRAVNYLYTKETRSSFAIENEVASGRRAERFVAALRSAKSFDPSDVKSLIELQNAIVDPRYSAHDLRNFQNFIGETVGGYREVVHFVCPRPEDVGALMSGWSDMLKRLKGSIDPVLAATLVAFGFVFIHPFEDGNGRIHRYLMHHVLSSEGYTPPGVLFPISAAIVRDRAGYDAALETFSNAIQPYIEWEWRPGKVVEVKNDTADLYRYFDATPLAEFMYAKVAETIRKDLKDELDFVSVFEAALSAVESVVDMPDRRASLFVRLCLQNGGVLSKKKRAEFAELTDNEIALIESAIGNVRADHAPLDQADPIRRSIG
jgi:Fic/DOC family